MVEGLAAEAAVTGGARLSPKRPYHRISRDFLLALGGLCATTWSPKPLTAQLER